MNYMDYTNFLIRDYCTRKGMHIQELTKEEIEVLEWAASIDEECILIDEVRISDEVYSDGESYELAYVCFPRQYLWDEEFDGEIVYETGLLGQSFFEYHDRKQGLTKEDIQGFIEEYRKEKQNRKLSR